MKVIVVDGIIGAGKTSFLRELGKRIKANIIYEPTDLWHDILIKFYENPKKYSLAFQIYAFATRLKTIKDSLDNSEIVILERSIWTDRYVFLNMLKKQGYIDETEYLVYTSMWDFLKETWEIIIDSPSLYIYLDTDIEVAMGRVKKRARDGESNLDINYQEELRSEHIMFYTSIDNNNKIIINGSSDANSDEYKSMVDYAITKIIA